MYGATRNQLAATEERIGLPLPMRFIVIVTKAIGEVGKLGRVRRLPDSTIAIQTL